MTMKLHRVLTAAVCVSAISGCMPSGTQPPRLVGAPTVPRAVAPASVDLERVKHEAVTQMLGRTRYRVNHESITSAQVASIVENAARWLVDEFGPPPNMANLVTIEVGSKGTKHAVMRFKGDKRSIFLDILNFFEGQEHYVIHEMFHAYYQTNEFFKHPISTTEGWAAYAQYRYKFQNLSNAALVNRALSDVGVSLHACADYNRQIQAGVDPDTLWRRNIGTNSELAYVYAACPLFARDHGTNAASYRLRYRVVFACGKGNLSNAIIARPGFDINVWSVQQCLTGLGYAIGVVDGIAGPSTSNGVVAFQLDRGLPQTGTVEEALLLRVIAAAES